MQRMSIPVIAATSLIWLHQARAEDAYGRCKHEHDPALKLQACSTVVSSSRDQNHVFWAHNGRGLALCNLDRCAEAIDDFTAAIRYDSSIAGIFDNRARALRSAGRFDEAIADSDRAIKMAPTMAFVYFGKATSLEKAGRYNAALTAIDQARIVDPGNAGVWIFRGKVLGELDRYDEAYATYDQAIALNPDDDTVFKARSETEHAQGRLEAAIEDLRRYQQSSKNDVDAAATMAQLESELNERAKAKVAVQPDQSPIAAQATLILRNPPPASSADGSSNTKNPDPAGCSAVRLPAARLACFDAAAAITSDAATIDRRAKAELPAVPAQPDADSMDRRAVAVVSEVAAAPFSQVADTKVLGAGDLALMHETYKKNQARFFRDYKDKRFSAVLPLHNVVESIFDKGSYNISFGDGGWGGDVSCKIADQPTIDLITNLDKGDRMLIEGAVADHTLGSVNLEGCRLHKG